MKKIISILGILMVLSMNIAFAQTIDVGSVPGDGFTYATKRVVENFRLFLSRDPTAHAKLQIKFLERRELELRFIELQKPERIEKGVSELKKYAETIKPEEVPEVLRPELERKLNNSLTRLLAIKLRFETDSNPNNDNALSGIMNAIQSHYDSINKVREEKNMTRLEVTIGTDGVSHIEGVVNGQTVRYDIQSADTNVIIADVSSRTGIDVETLKAKTTTR